MYNIIFDSDTKSIKLTATGVLVLNDENILSVCRPEKNKKPISEATGMRAVDCNIIPMIHEITSVGKEHLEELAGIQEIWKKTTLIRQ